MKHGRGHFNPGSMKMLYRDKFEKFDRIFGRENVTLRKFDPATFTGKCAVTDFCEQTGVILPADFQIKRVNESLSREACGMLFAYRKFGPGYGVGKNVIKENIALLKAFQDMSGAKFDLADSIYRKAAKREAEDFKWMEERLSTSLAEKARENPAAIKDEEDLLTITRESCEEFAACFQKRYGVGLSLEQLPATSPVDPAKAAELVQSARLALQRLQDPKTSRTPWQKARKTSARAIRSILRLPRRFAFRR
ncbi:MAG: hypothetical protein EOP85_02615 [Verrucomicrobiaceae bacterium]|nr:MAG: hypothetical protein EOP85_02615 [Verrucomicrobiaceae bacterium]